MPSSGMRGDLERIDTNTDQMETKIDATKTAVDQAKAEIIDVEADVEATKTAVDQAKAEIQDVEADVEATKTAVDQAKAEIQDVEADVEATKAAVDATNALLTIMKDSKTLIEGASLADVAATTTATNACGGGGYARVVGIFKSTKAATLVPTFTFGAITADGAGIAIVANTPKVIDLVNYGVFGFKATNDDAQDAADFSWAFYGVR